MLTFGNSVSFAGSTEQDRLWLVRE